jgi:hypothetical protein
MRMTHHHRPDMSLRSHTHAHSTNHLARLPNEMIVRILSNLESAQITLAASTCVRLWRVCSDDSCWRSAFEVNFCCLPLR